MPNLRQPGSNSEQLSLQHITRPDYATVPLRPRGVKWLGALYLVTALGTLTAIFSLDSAASGVGPVFSLLGAAAIYLALGIGVLRLRRWAYWIALALHIAVALAVPLLLLAQLYIVALITLAFSIVICYYLRRADVRRAFGV